MVNSHRFSRNTSELLWISRRPRSKGGTGVPPISKVCGSILMSDKTYHVMFSSGSDELIFIVSDKTAFELPLSNVSNTNISGKNEVSLEFGGPVASTSKQTLPDELVEIRFYIPASSKAKDRSGSESDDGDDFNPSESFYKAVKAKTTKEGQSASSLILNFEDVLLLTPRGRYDMEMYSDSLRLRGKTYDYKIIYSNVSRVFLLPKDNAHLLFIVSRWYVSFCPPH
jgi:structure-specific recognition protein 1